MQGIDRLGWTVGRSYTAYGVRFGIRSNDLRVWDRIEQRLPPGARTSITSSVPTLFSVFHAPQASRSVRRFHLLYSDALRLSRTLDFDWVLETLESSMQLLVAEFSRHRLFIHAGVVGWNGRAIVLPGNSFTGKSTLVAELVRQGATYYSDEYAVVDRSGRVWPYPRRLAIRGSVPGVSRISPEAIGTVGKQALRPGWIVSTRFREGASWRPRTVTRGVSVLEMLSNTVSVRGNPPHALDMLRRLCSKSVAFRSDRGEAEVTAARILKACSTHD